MPGQLQLFGGRRQRGRAAPAPLEFGMHCMIADTLRRWATPDWRFTHLPFGEQRTPIAGARLKRMGTQPGWPDFLFVPPLRHPMPRPHFLELKRPGHGRLSVPQQEFAQWCEANHCPFAIATSYQEAMEILGRWGVVRAGITVSA